MDSNDRQNWTISVSGGISDIINSCKAANSFPSPFLYSMSSRGCTNGVSTPGQTRGPYSRMTSLTKNGRSSRVSLERLADLAVHATVPPPDPEASIMEKGRERKKNWNKVTHEKKRNQQRESSIAEQKSRAGQTQNRIGTRRDLMST